MSKLPPNTIREFRRIDANVSLLLHNLESGDLDLVKMQAERIRKLNFDCYCKLSDALERGEFLPIQLI